MSNYNYSPEDFSDANEFLPPPNPSDTHISVSPFINIEKDPISFNFLVQAAIVDAKNYHILSYDELDEKKKELQLLESRYETLLHKIELEKKVGEAAKSLARLHEDGNKRASFLKATKRHSQQATDEHVISVRKITEMNKDAMELHNRITALKETVLQHSVAVLAYSQLNPAAAAAAQAEDPVKVGKQLDTLISQLGDDHVMQETENRDLPAKVQALSGLCQQLTQQCRDQIDHNTEMLGRVLESRDDTFDPRQYPHFHDMLSYLQEGREPIKPRDVGESKSSEASGTRDLSVPTPHIRSNSRDILDLQDALRSHKFASSAQIQDLNSELTLATEQVNEYRDKCDSLSRELDSVVQSLEDLTVQTVDYESERQRLEDQIGQLRGKLQEAGTSRAVTGLDVSGGPETESVTMLVHKFRDQIRTMRDEHLEELQKEQDEKKKLVSVVREIKRSSYIRV
ncbi:hypothetical protein CJU90_2035 [Yarrowia sp. C11]|nr:hypothetical protein CKK34_6062 [Yarrowia sp. E02]KAG5371965.1 hypothetical protein CJU90_2035 [Yarrowia sp. C11]